MTDTTKLGLGLLEMKNNTGLDNNEVKLSYTTLTFANTEGDNNQVTLDLTNNTFAIKDELNATAMSMDTNNGNITMPKRLTLSSTSDGFVMPVVTNVTTSIAAPVQGMQAYDQNTNTLSFYTGSGWINLDGGGGGGSVIQRTEVNTATYTILASDYIVAVRYTTTGACTLTLPLLSGLTENVIYIIKDEGNNAATNNITVNPSGADTIQNETSMTLTLDSQSMSIYSDRTNNEWFVF